MCGNVKSTNMVPRMHTLWPAYWPTFATQLKVSGTLWGFNAFYSDRMSTSIQPLGQQWICAVPDKLIINGGKVGTAEYPSGIFISSSSNTFVCSAFFFFFSIRHNLFACCFISKQSHNCYSGLEQWKTFITDHYTIRDSFYLWHCT